MKNQLSPRYLSIAALCLSSIACIFGALFQKPNYTPNTPQDVMPVQQSWPDSGEWILLRQSFSDAQYSPGSEVLLAINPKTGEVQRLPVRYLSPAEIWRKPHAFSTGAMITQDGYLALDSLYDQNDFGRDPAQWRSIDFSPQRDALAHYQKRGIGKGILVMRGDETVATLPGWAVSFSPDGRQAALARWEQYDDPEAPLGWSSKTFLEIYDFDTGQTTQVLESAATIEEVAWSPQGDWIAYAQKRLKSGGKTIEEGGLYLVSSNGGESRLVYTNYEIEQLSWSPSGEWLAFTAKQDGTKIYNLRTKKTRSLDARNFAWARQADKLVFLKSTASRFIDNQTGPIAYNWIPQYDVFVIENLNTFRERQITNLKMEFNGWVFLDWLDFDSPDIFTRPAE